MLISCTCKIKTSDWTPMLRQSHRWYAPGKLSTILCIFFGEEKLIQNCVTYAFYSRQPIAAFDISTYICLINIRIDHSEANPKNNWMRGEQPCLLYSEIILHICKTSNNQNVKIFCSLVLKPTIPLCHCSSPLTKTVPRPSHWHHPRITKGQNILIFLPIWSSYWSEKQLVLLLRGN